MASLFSRAWQFSVNPVSKFLKPRIELVIPTMTTVPNRTRKAFNNHPRKRYSPWLLKQDRVLGKEELTTENTQFIQEIVESGFAEAKVDCVAHHHGSPLKIPPIEPIHEWTPQSRRTGVIARKIGIYPMWLNDGTKVLTTLLHICDNHVIKYIPPGEWKPMIQPSRRAIIPKRNMGCLIVGADRVDPQLFTKQYCGLFTEAGVMPKRLLARFTISPDAALQPGTPLTAAHYRPGHVVDIRAKTMDRGFQGVMKRWGFKGMPATHGVTKTHRRPGNIGSGGTKARVMPGTKLPGHMGNRYRIFRGVKILRINTKYNVIWVLGQALPGETNSLLQIYDTILPARKPTGKENAPPFPTFIPLSSSSSSCSIKDEMWSENLHEFDAPTLKFEMEDKK